MKPLAAGLKAPIMRFAAKRSRSPDPATFAISPFSTRGHVAEDVRRLWMRLDPTQFTKKFLLKRGLAENT
ncbi:unnamed protein product [Phyllotreta striolata]|uniref:Uncharacterized protein n=1 Tax=Phyllotreta striolata TaxID=444603 RepID=A0A9N9TLV7_PHYSR|nr:unnamed protein product [Phyllotreta striolata]